MSSRTDTANRFLLILLGLVLGAAGGLGLALSFGLFGSAPARVLPGYVRRYPHGQPWFWPVVALAGAVLALLALRWLIAQLSTDRAGRIDLTRDPKDGLTGVHATALTDAVAEEAETLRGVTGASAALREHHGRRLALTVDLADHADVAEVRTALGQRVVGHARTAVDDPDLPVDIQLRPARGRGDRGLR